MRATLSKSFFLISGWLCLALGFVGVFLPLLPTTPFILLAVFCFSKGSEKMHRWLLQHPKFGPSIHDWQNHGIIRLRAKLISTVLIVGLFAYTLYSVPVQIFIKAIVATIGVCVLLFIWTRPSTPQR